MKKVKNHARYLLDNGLIFEINRKVLHPLGLALVADVHPENSKWVTISGLVQVDDEEGFIFDDETFEQGRKKYELFLHKSGDKKLKSRKEKLGYIVQEGKEENNEI